ncbi:protein phosphatase 1 regulatory subunit 17 [Paramormyrops kingsleyae]|uniref:protein phosphatase 1 regulatory subunit 17 n=1 Tax=Paramormyrops kingsleyae TaxID=1676925 RepID=UPI000CD64C4D|nr:protein phosphatase 1 regulatory subunit 17 [Paramormyrops kingsleyae]XP_023671484.1 protein phosphatase 1 regulatory subunit 17 [Paramormyrops kingsleyae]
MSADCARSSPETGGRVLSGAQDYACPIANIPGKLTTGFGLEPGGAHGLGAPGQDERHEQESKKPRRKDTPVLKAPPLLPGVKLIKEKRCVIHMEDEEKD